MKGKSPHAHRPGVIRPEEVLTSAELRARLGWGDRAFNRARASGLPCRRVGNTRFISGHDFIAWLQRQPQEEIG